MLARGFCQQIGARRGGVSTTCGRAGGGAAAAAGTSPGPGSGIKAASDPGGALGRWVSRRPLWGRGRSSLSKSCQIPEGEGGSACLHLPVSKAEPEHNVVQDCFYLKVRSALVGLIRCGWKHRWVKYPMSQAVSGKASSYSLMYPPPSSLTIPKGSSISQQTGHLLGEGRIWTYKDQFPILKIPWRSLVIIFAEMEWTHLLNDLGKFPS